MLQLVRASSDGHGVGASRCARILEPPPPPPLHATRADAAQISNAPNVNAEASFLPDFLAMMAVRASTKSNPSHRTKSGALGLLGEHIGKTEDGAVVEIANVEVVEPEPGVTLPR